MEYFWIDGQLRITHLHITPKEIALPDLIGGPAKGDRLCRAALSELECPRQLPKTPEHEEVSIRARVRRVPA